MVLLGSVLVGSAVGAILTPTGALIFSGSLLSVAIITRKMAFIPFKAVKQYNNKVKNKKTLHLERHKAQKSKFVAFPSYGKFKIFSLMVYESYLIEPVISKPFFQL